MHNAFSTAGFWAEDLDERRLAAWVDTLLAEILPNTPSLGLVFISPRYFAEAATILGVIRARARMPVLLGCSTNSLIAGEREIEDQSGIALGLYSLPGVDLQAARFTQEQVEEWNGAGYWHLETGRTLEDLNGWLAFADPFSLDAESWLRQWNDAYPGIPILGGLASGDYAARQTQVYLNEVAYPGGGVAVSIGGQVDLASVISQGCTPFGDTWTITRTDRNLILQIANRPAYEVLREAIEKLPPDLQQATRGNLFIGLVINEYLDEFQRGDFLIRNILGVDADSGAIAIGAIPRPGQTIQFQRRDAQASTEDMTVLLRRAQNLLSGRRVFGGCLCSCNGRGRRLFGTVDHDARHVQQAFGPMGLTGFFCNGELGPIADRNFLHGYTASLGLFVQREG
jgi:small ligand-binding sensory domain FIST